jgi:hypothetical protein
MFQPNAFEVVTPERLLEWEHSIANYFGLPSPRFDKEDVARSATWSNTGGGPGDICADDSDYQAQSGDVPVEPGPADRLAAAVAAGRRPTIFMWQISRFIVVPEDRLAEWERQIREQVGMPVAAIGTLEQAGSGSWSATLPNDCMDDSDYMEA